MQETERKKTHRSKHVTPDKTGHQVHFPDGPAAGPSVYQTDELSPVRGRVLLMDDDAAFRDTLTYALSLGGYSVSVACNGEEAVEAYRRSHESGMPMDAVILDLNIPGGMGGKEAITLLRRMDPSVRAIVASGSLDDPALRHPREWGFSAALMKPFPLEDLMGLLKEITGTGQP